MYISCPYVSLKNGLLRKHIILKEYFEKNSFGSEVCMLICHRILLAAEDSLPPEGYDPKLQ